MKKFLIIIASLVVLLLLLHVAFFIFVNTKGKDIIANVIEDNFGVDTSIESFKVSFPFGIDIEGFKSKDLSFEKAKISLSSVNPFAKSVVLNKIYIDKFQVKILKDAAGVIVGPLAVKRKPTPSKEAAQTAITQVQPDKVDTAKTILSKEKTAFTITIKRFHLKDSIVDLVFAKEGKVKTITLEDIDLQLKNIVYPKLDKFYIKLETALKTSAGINSDITSINGWVDYPNKNMDVNFSSGLIDYSLFNEYYSNFWSKDSLGIKEAKFSLNTNLKAEKNDLTISGILSLDEISFAQSDVLSNRDLLRTAVALLKGNKEKATLNFELKTKMDSPALDFSFLKKAIFQQTIQINPISAVGVIADQVKGKIEGVDDLTVDTAVDVIEGIADTIGSIFKRREK